MVYIKEVILKTVKRDSCRNEQEQSEDSDKLEVMDGRTECSVRVGK